MLTHRYQKVTLRLFVLIAFCSTFVRIFFGVDFTDESQYVAQIVGPLKGGTLFITDRLFQQSGSILATPLAYLYIQLVGSTEGIVLFVRFLFFTASFATAFTLFKIFSKRISFDASLAIAALSLTYIPYNVQSVSYNTMAVLFSTLSLLLARQLADKENKSVRIFLAATVALGVFSYPPLCLGYLVLFLFYFKRKDLRKSLLITMAWAIGFITILMLPVMKIGVDEIQTNFDLAKLVSLLTLSDKVRISFYYLREIAPSWPFLATIAVVSAILFYLKKSIELIALPILAVFYIFFASIQSVDVGGAFIIYGIPLSLVFIALKRIQAHSAWQINIEIVVAVIIGLTAGITSSNGLLNSAMGLSIAMLFLFESYIAKNRKFPWAAWLSAVCVLCFAQWTFFYRESSIANLTYQVESGPYYGLFTIEAKRNLLAEVEADLSRLPAGTKSILSYDSFPAGYLFTDLKPQTFMYYMHPAPIGPALRPLLVRMFSTDSNLPDVVLEMNWVPVTEKSVFLTKDVNKNIFNDPFWNFIKDNKTYRTFLQKPNYSIYIKNAF